MTYAAPEFERLLQVGTTRARPALDQTLPPSLDMPALGAGAATQEERLWLSLAALDLWQRAGHSPAPGAASPAHHAADAEELPARCPARAEAMLGLLLQGGHSATLLGEWLQELHRRGGRLPVRFLASLLELATQQKQLRPLVAQVLGTRGYWTARLDPDWAWALDTDGREERTVLWETGSLAQRSALLRDWRRVDAAAARLALEGVWKTEPPENRAALLPCLGVALQSADEPFLEAALDDRRKEVRTAAQRLLACLPGSALSGRMLERLQPLVRIERPLLRAARLDLALPQERDAAMVRDGVGAASHAGLGEKAGWVVDMLACVAPERWEEQFGCDATGCLALASKSEFNTVFIRGWSSAVQQRLEQDAAPALLSWLTALGALWLDTEPQQRLAFPDTFFRACASLPPEHEYRLLGQLLDAGPAEWKRDPGRFQLLDEAARRSAQAWPAGLSHKVLERACDALSIVATHNNLHWWFGQMLGALAPVLDPAAAVAHESALRGRAAGIDALQGGIDKFFSLVQMRHEISLSFQEQA